jgi:Ca2+-binding EF-hand superfamily protein
MVSRVKDIFSEREREMTPYAFRKMIASFPQLNMPEEEIDTLFGVLDSDGSGTVTNQELTDLLAALAPESVLQAMGNDDEDVDASDSRTTVRTTMRSLPPAEEEDEEEKEEAPSKAAAGMALQERADATTGR